MTHEGDKQFCDEFLAGQRDCLMGVPHTDKSDAYTRGYKAQYEAEQVATWRTEKC